MDDGSNKKFASFEEKILFLNWLFNERLEVNEINIEFNKLKIEQDKLFLIQEIFLDISNDVKYLNKTFKANYSQLKDSKPQIDRINANFRKVKDVKDINNGLFEDDLIRILKEYNATLKGIKILKTFKLDIDGYNQYLDKFKKIKNGFNDFYKDFEIKNDGLYNEMVYFYIKEIKKNIESTSEHISKIKVIRELVDGEVRMSRLKYSNEYNMKDIFNERQFKEYQKKYFNLRIKLAMSDVKEINIKATISYKGVIKENIKIKMFIDDNKIAIKKKHGLFSDNKPFQNNEDVLILTSNNIVYIITYIINGKGIVEINTKKDYGFFIKINKINKNGLFLFESLKSKIIKEQDKKVSDIIQSSYVLSEIYNGLSHQLEYDDIITRYMINKFFIYGIESKSISILGINEDQEKYKIVNDSHISPILMNTGGDWGVGAHSSVEQYLEYYTVPASGGLIRIRERGVLIELYDNQRKYVKIDWENIISSKSNNHDLDIELTNGTIVKLRTIDYQEFKNSSKVLEKAINIVAKGAYDY